MCRHLKFANEAFTITCAVHVEDCEGWWLSGDRSSVAEHWQLAQTRSPRLNSCHLPTFLLPNPSFLLTSHPAVAYGAGESTERENPRP